jgi:hypothetical protein
MAVSPLFGVPQGIGQGVLAPDQINTPDLSSLSNQISQIPTQVTPDDVNHDHSFEETDPKHTGFTGIARDVLGTLGDFLLTRLHMKPMYAPSQDNRRLNEAMEGYNQDPQAAIDRVSDVDFNTGARLRQQYVTDQLSAAQKASLEQYRNSQEAYKNGLQTMRNRNIAGAMLNTIDPQDPKAAQMYSAARQRILAAYGSSDDQLGTLLPENYDPDAIDQFTGGSMQALKQDVLASRDSMNDAMMKFRYVRQGDVEDRNEVLRKQGDARIDQGNARIAQGDAKLDQGQQTINQRGDHYKVTEAQGQQNADTRANAVGGKYPGLRRVPAGNAKGIPAGLYQDTGNGKYKRVGD